jgi:2-oxo-hept-3-ene-1,7-dioate hydratase
MLSPQIVAALVAGLSQARKTRTQVRHFSKRHPEMTIEDGYAIPREWVRLERPDGRTVRGRKIGHTSRALQQRSQITEPDYAPLMDDMFFEAGGDIPADRFIAPRVEVELAFVMGKPLRGRGVTVCDVLSAAEWVTPAIEIIDARIEQLYAGDIVLAGSFTRPIMR